MKVTFDKSFSKSIDKLKNRSVATRVIKFIEECEKASTLKSLKSIKKMTGYKNFYRYKIGDYRIGFEFDKDEINLIIVAHREDIYKVFP